MSNADAAAPASPALLQTVMRELQAAAGSFCRDESDALVERVTANVGEAAERSLRIDDQEILKASHEALQRGAESFTNLLRQHFASGILKAIESERAPSPAPKPSTGTTQRLELIGMDDMERDVLTVNMVRKLEDYCADTLSPLTLRLCHLKGTENFNLELNPFRPEVFVRSFIGAWEAFDANKSSTRVMMGALDTPNFLPLNALYLELNSLLITRGVMREEKYKIKRTVAPRRGPDSLWTRSHVLPAEEADPSGAIAAYNALLAASGAVGVAAGSAPASGAGSAYHFNPARFLHQVTLLLEHVGATGAGTPAIGDSAAKASASPAALAAPDASLMARLDALLSERAAALAAGPAAAAPVDPLSISEIEELRDAPESLSSNDLDRASIEMVGRVFQFVLDDPAIPTGLKVLIARLQLPALKAALTDRSFFVQDDHPARRLIDTLAHAALYWDESDSTFSEAVGSIVARAGSSTSADAATFAPLVEELERALDAERERHDARIASSIAEAIRAEQRDDARRDVSVRLEGRMAESPIDDDLAEFLRGPWRAYLLECALERDTQPEAWKNALEKTDLLIWSVQPKSSPAESNQLRAALPGLLACLNAGLDRIDYKGAPRLGFFNYLMKRQALTVRRSISVAPAVPGPPFSSAAQQVAEPDQLGEIDMAFDAFGTTAGEALERGQWFALDLGLAQPLKYRLSWVSPKRTQFVFTKFDRGDTLVKSLAEVEALMASGALRVIDDAPLVQRAIAASAGLA